MRLMQRPAWLVAAALLVAGCGGGSGSERLIYKSAPPTDLTVSGPPEALKLSWTAAPHALRYHVYWSSDPEQWIANYAAYPDAGLETTEDTSVELDFTGMTRHIYFQVTGEIDLEGDPAFAVALLGYRIDGDDVEDHVQDLRWNRCPEGMTFQNEDCIGTAEKFTSADAEAFATPTPEGFRAPTRAEWVSLMTCAKHPEERFDAAHDAACEALLKEVLAGHGNLEFYLRDDDYCTEPDHILTGTPQGRLACYPKNSAEVRVTLVQPL